MEITELGAIGELLGGVAVIASLIFVGLQIRQNTTVQRTVGGEATVGLLIDIQTSVAENSDLARIMIAGGSGDRTLETEDYFRFHLMARSVFIQFDIARVKWSNGLLDDSQWHTAQGFFEDAIKSVGMQRWWQENSAHFSESLREYVEPYLEEPKSVPAQPPV